MNKSALVIGAGIVGVATARALAIKGYKVQVFDRSEKPVGATIRNFGMIWPIGQPTGKYYNRALRSREIWIDVLTESKTWYNPSGSVHVAYRADEWQVIQEYVEVSQAYRPVSVLTAEETLERSPALQTKGILGSLYSADEMIVDPREAIMKVIGLLEQKYQVEFHWNRAITQINGLRIYSGVSSWQADEIYVCSGVDFETLYPEIFAETAITKCKIQMLRTVPQPQNWQLGPSIGGGLSFIHYKGFHVAPSLAKLTERIEREYAEYLKWGIHVMVSQNGSGELTIGDSHEYGLTFDPFDKTFINRMVLDYLAGMATFPDETIAQSWHGIYPKMTNGSNEFVHSPEPGVTIINGLGGAGMTLSFGLCEEVINGTYSR
ncbi:TIGR03364 family FAD-dependent oxidoreductase [Siphonobacter sp. SORGH_AS_1065]|uniref:TIGR03364 family FAD-dependent oxidoreductase n=1 Tax=Siphonobacter sp. SORGH_AS_1065 TaxID=3041795 RepID=UPI00277DE35E|nr:TIGR03364 family FAD-dependent oxidoreductase [Siphonobacter sp. SORGH_AS_1065]MDQ1089925.1 FAD dependent oxidoreductase TIGR03364 [Siphonobacter sp. SORGH_AS_1065]